MFMVLASTAAILLVLGVGGGVLTLVCRLPVISGLLDTAFDNSPLGREEVQELNRAEGERATKEEPVPHRGKRLA